MYTLTTEALVAASRLSPAAAITFSGQFTASEVHPGPRRGTPAGQCPESDTLRGLLPERLYPLAVSACFYLHTCSHSRLHQHRLVHTSSHTHTLTQACTHSHPFTYTHTHICTDTGLYTLTSTHTRSHLPPAQTRPLSFDAWALPASCAHERSAVWCPLTRPDAEMSHRQPCHPHGVPLLRRKAAQCLGPAGHWATSHPAGH